MQNNNQQLHAQLEQLESALESSSIDDENWFNRSDVFVSSAFYTKSNELTDYIQEVRTNIVKLSQLSDQAYLEFLAEKVTQQFACLKSLLNAASVQTKDKQYRSKQQSKVCLLYTSPSPRDS